MSAPYKSELACRNRTATDCHPRWGMADGRELAAIALISGLGRHKRRTIDWPFRHQIASTLISTLSLFQRLHCTCTQRYDARDNCVWPLIRNYNLLLWYRWGDRVMSFCIQHNLEPPYWRYTRVSLQTVVCLSLSFKRFSRYLLCF